VTPQVKERLNPNIGLTQSHEGCRLLGTCI
jgi:hypothetical protein